jgi:hypothetical protein
VALGLVVFLIGLLPELYLTSPLILLVSKLRPALGAGE